jgi:tRNA modification GTPase
VVIAGVFRPFDPGRWDGAGARLALRHEGVLALPDFHAEVPAAVLLWPGRRSYTGEPSAEIHTLGSPPLLEVLLDALFVQGARPACRGEFTLRAFLAGRIDLTQAEAVLGVIDAEDHVELEMALRQLAGGLSGRLGAVRASLLDLLAELEAGLDFVDEDIEFVTSEETLRRLREASGEVGRLLAASEARMTSRGRRRVVLAGLPNAGKSSLFNALAGADAALVSPVAGTTRDYLVADVEWDGHAFELIDTAGWEAGGDAVARQVAALREDLFPTADLVLSCSAADLSPAERQRDRALREEIARGGPDVLPVQTKADLAAPPEPGAVAVSARTGAGLDELRAAVGRRFSTARKGERLLLGSTAARGRESLRAAAEALSRVTGVAECGAGDELMTLELRDALDHLGRILGHVYTDDVLDRIFSKFCIGK